VPAMQPVLHAIVEAWVPTCMLRDNLTTPRVTVAENERVRWTGWRP